MYYQPTPPPWGSPPQQRSARPPWLVPTVLIAVLAVVIAGTVGVILFVNRGSDDKSKPVAGQLRNTFPKKPTLGWQIAANDIFDGAVFVQPVPSAYWYDRPGFIDLGDTLITSAILPDSDEPAELVAIDVDTGKVRWSTDDLGSTPVCASATVDGLLPCLAEDRVSFLRMSNGSVDHRLTAPLDASLVEVRGDDVYTLGYKSMARGTASDLTATWEQAYSIEPQCPGSGDSQYYAATDSVVYFGSDAGVVVADVDNGRRVLPDELQGVHVYPGQGFTGRICEGNDPSEDELVVVGENGDVLRRIDTETRAAEPWLVTPSADQPYIVGRTAYDFASGEELWTASGGPEVDSLRTVIGGVVLGGGRFQEGPLEAFDLATGENLWSAPVSGELTVSDGERVMVRDAGVLASINLTTGQQEWVIAGVDQQAVAPAGSGFAVAEAESITFYPPTGPPSVAPGSADTAGGGQSDQPSSGGLITRCGQVPEMRPVEYRTENDGLIVKMEIKASCPDGDIVSTDGMNVSITDAGSLIAAGIFDFSSETLYLPGNSYGAGAAGVQRELKFGIGSFFRLPNSLGTQSGSGGSVTAGGAQVVECKDEGTSTGPTSVNSPPSSTGTTPVIAKRGTTANRDPEAAATDALRAQVNADRPFVVSDLAERWVAQLSAKRVGLVAPDVDGRVVTWTATEILQQHLRLRLQYPEVRLVWSDEWSTFDLKGWWITIAGLTFPDPDAANGWCDARAIPVDECFAKIVSNTRGPDGTTKYRR